MALMSVKKSAGDRLKEAREAKGLSQEALGEMASLTRMTIYRLEQGTESARLSTLRQVADALGLRLVDLVDLEESPIEPTIQAYLESLYAKIDNPTEPEINWLRAQTAAFWDGIDPSPAAVHDMVQFRRKFPGKR